MLYPIRGCVFTPDRRVLSRDHSIEWQLHWNSGHCVEYIGVMKYMQKCQVIQIFRSTTGGASGREIEFVDQCPEVLTHNSQHYISRASHAARSDARIELSTKLTLEVGVRS